MISCRRLVAPGILPVFLLLLATLFPAAPGRSAEAGTGLGGASTVNSGGTALPVTDLQQELVRQQQIKATTSRVATQLESVIAEFDRNGIAGEDVKVLRAIRSVLDRLSEKDMGRVLEYLQQSRAATDPSAAARTATEAFAGQKSIVVQLQQLVLEYQQQQALYEIALRLKELASRQTANMWLGVSLARSTEGKTGFSQFDENQKISLRYQQSEQTPLKEEVAAILGRLERVAREITDGPSAERAKAATQQARDGKVLPTLDSATQELKEDKLKLLSAVGNEKTARDQLRDIARMLVLSPNMTDALQQALLELDRAIDSERKVMLDTEKVKKKEETERRATDQAIVVDETDLIRRDIDSLSPIAAEHLRSATDRMQSAREDLNSGEEPRKKMEQAVPKQEEALLQMQMARRAIQEQLARLEEKQNAEQPENNLAALRQLQKEVRELIQQEEKHKEDTAATERTQLRAKAPRQGELKDKAQDLQARAADPSPLAAQSLGEASSQMHKAQNSLAQLQNNAPAQQAALDALQQAEQQLEQDIDKLEQAEKDLAKLEELLKRLIVIIDLQQKAQSATAHLAVQPTPRPENVQPIAAGQGKLGTATTALMQETESLLPPAASHLGDAARHMTSAKGHLDQLAPASAEPAQGEALAAHYLAKKEFETKIDDLRDMLGIPAPDKKDALAEAQKRIEEAQRQVSEAQRQLQQAPPGVMEALQKQQQEISETLHELRQDAADAQPIAPAEQSAKEAGQRLAKSDIPGAIESMKSARQAMKRAGQQAAGKQARTQAPAQPTPPKPPAQSPSQALGELADKQEKVQQAAEAMAQAQQNTPQSAMDAASKALQKANDAINPLTSGELGEMPAGAQPGLQSAQQSTAKGSAQAAGGQNSPAQQSAADAAQALAQAQAALALAQSGVGSQAANQPGQGKGQGQGQGQGKAKGSGKGQGKGSGQAQANSQGQGQGQPDPHGTGRQGNFNGAGGADGDRQAGAGSSTFTRLPNRDRAALQQSQAEKYPQEYGPLVEQYLRNLSDQAGDK